MEGGFNQPIQTEPIEKSSRRWIWLIVLIVIIGLCVGAYFIFVPQETRNEILDSISSSTNTCETQYAKEIPSEVVSIELAEYVASEYYPKFLIGGDRNNKSAYDYIGYETMYDLEGLPKAYIFLYRKKGGPGNSVEELKQITWDIKADAGPTKYQLFGVQTAIVSAINTESPLIRCYGGLPSVMVIEPGTKEYINENYPDYELGRIIYLSSSQIFYEIVLPKNKGKIPLDENTLLIDDHTKDEVQKVSELRKQQEEIEKRNKEAREEMAKQIQDEDMKKQFLESEANRKLANIEKWKEFEDEMNS